ncbi:hypothetical protein V8D89_000939 [Ganoderma adspersum]
MRPMVKTPLFHSFLRLVSTFVSCTLFCALALADSHLVDDQDHNPNIDWDGPWRQTSHPSAMDETLTLGNQTGETITFTFTGTSVKVYGAFTPVGLWVMSSVYAVDDGIPTVFTPSPEVLQEAFRQEFYDSGALPAGDHTLQITNMGVQLWLDYFQFDDNTGWTSASVTTSVIATTDAQSSSATIITSSESSLSGSSQDGSSGGTPSSTSHIATSFQPITTISDITSASFSSIPPAGTSSPAKASSLRAHPPSRSPSPTLSQNTTTPLQGAQIPEVNAHRHGMSYGKLIGLIAGTVLGVVLLALLLQLWRGHLRARQLQTQKRRLPLLFGGTWSILRVVSAWRRARGVAQTVSRRIGVDGGRTAADAEVLEGEGEADAPSICESRTDAESELDADLEGGAGRDSEAFVGYESW